MAAIENSIPATLLERAKRATGKRTAAAAVRELVSRAERYEANAETRRVLDSDRKGARRGYKSFDSIEALFKDAGV